jgi:hypothetical protein
MKAAKVEGCSSLGLKMISKWIVRAIIGLLAIVGALVLVIGLMFDGITDYALGRMDRIAGQSFYDVDRIEIFLLTAPAGVKGQGTFPVRAYDRDYPFYGTATITGAEAEKAAELWASTIKAARIQAMCHEPPYGIRMYSGQTLRFETSICWSCNNFCIEAFPGTHTFWGFDAKSQEAKDLLALFDSKLPYPKGKRDAGEEPKEKD